MEIEVEVEGIGRRDAPLTPLTKSKFKYLAGGEHLQKITEDISIEIHE